MMLSGGADHESAKAASRIGRLNRPRELNEEQSRQVRQDSPKILELAAVRGDLTEFGVVKVAEGSLSTETTVYKS
jgi:hypothetical protein